ncbi:hypothetical protein [Streptomyces sp. 8N706]|uniref:hypothetical protein n=1 Tax=Streptomyces sp. 8N706 TaxID=3457416 RepID=UPI003FD016AA
MFALASAVVLAVALPQAVATAGPEGPKGRAESVGGDSGAAAGSPLHTSARATGHRPSGGEGILRGPGLPSSPDRRRGTAECGPELVSPEGVEAQTCLMSQGPALWGRTYYRNATGRTLRTVLALMRPDGRTVQVRCTAEASNDRGVCETPREPVGAPAAEGRPYGAVAEIVSVDQGRMLLRSGSNSPPSAAS